MRKHLLVPLILISSILLSNAVSAAEFTEGKEYILLDKEDQFTITKENEVTEFFDFGCIFCYRLEPSIKKWLITKPSNVDFNLVPALFSKRVVWSAQLYAVMETLGTVDTMKSAVYDKYHKGGGINSHQDIYDLFKIAGIDQETVTKTYDSFVVSNLLKKYEKLTKQSGISGTPSFIVKGKYRTSASLAGGQDKIFDIIDYLLKFK